MSGERRVEGARFAALCALPGPYTVPQAAEHQWAAIGASGCAQAAGPSLRCRPPLAACPYRQCPLPLSLLLIPNCLARFAGVKEHIPGTAEHRATHPTGTGTGVTGEASQARALEPTVG